MATYGQTSRLHIQYPFNTAPTDVPQDIETPLNTIDSVILPIYFGTISARPTPGTYTTPSVTGQEGRLYYATDNGVLFFDNGSDWVALGPVSSSAGSITQSAPGNSATAGGGGLSAGVSHRHSMPGWGVQADYKPSALTATPGESGRFADASHVHPGLEVGVPIPWPGPSVPSGYIQLNGAVLVRATYPVLFSNYGTTWNTGGESGTQFRLPNFTDRVLAGAGNLFSVGHYYGQSSIALTNSNLPYHAHSITDQVHHHTGTTTNENASHDHNTPADSAIDFPGSTLNLVSSPGTGVTFSSQLTGSNLQHHGHNFTTSFNNTGITTTNPTGTGVAFTLVQPTAGILWITRAG